MTVQTFELAEAEPQPAQEIMAPSASQPSQLLALAVEQGADIEKLEKLMALQERWEAKEAKKAFSAALSEFQSILPEIKKKKNVSFNTTNYNYAPLGDIVAQIREPMYMAGLSYRFEQEHTDNLFKVTCIVSHKDGHSETTSMEAGRDTSGKKNDIQGIGSTITYLQRYTICSALGIVTADEDIDGRISSENITTGQAESIKARIEAIGGKIDKFCAGMAIPTIEAMPIAKYAQADSILTQREARVTHVIEQES